MLKKILIACVLLVFINQIHAQSINLVTSTNITHSGVGAPPTQNIDVGSGKNRILVAYYWVERDHRPSPYGDNYPGGATFNSFMSPTFGGNNMVARTENNMRYIYTVPSGNIRMSMHMQLFYYRIPDTFTGNVAFNPGVTNPATQVGSDMIITLAVYENVSQKSINDNLGPAFGTSYKPQPGSGFLASNVNSFLADMTPSSATVADGGDVNDITYYGIGASTNQESLTINGAGWNQVGATVSLTNNNGGPWNNGTDGSSGTGDSDVLQRAIRKESDGMTLLAASFKGSSPTDLRFNRANNDYVLMGRAHVVTLLPLAKPSYSGMVVRDVTGPGSIEGSGTNAAAGYVNAVDEDGNVVFSAVVSAGGNFSIPRSYLVEGIPYELVLTNSPTANVPTLVPGWAFVGESLSTSGNDGNADGILEIIPGLSDVSTLRFGVNICNADQSQPIATTTELSFVCPATGVNLSDAGIATPPSGSSVRWFATNSSAGTPLTGTAVTNAGVGSYWAFYYDSVANCYSSTGAEVTVTSICAQDDTYNTSSGLDGTTFPISVLSNDTSNEVLATTTTVTLTVTDTADPVYIGAPVPVLDTDGNVTVPAGTPGGIYEIEYQICANPAGTPCDTALVTVNVDNWIDAQDDDFGTFTPGTAAVTPSVLDNDEYNGLDATTSNVSVSTAGTWPTGFTLNPDGTISIAPGLTPGDYTLQYEICAIPAGSPCDIADVTLTVSDFVTIHAVEDINQTPINVAVDGNVLTNDESILPVTVTNATFTNSAGVEQSLPIGVQTQIYSNGSPAGYITLNANGTYTFEPALGFVGDVEIGYTITNSEGTTDSSMLEIKVIPNVSNSENNNPVAQNDVLFTESNTASSSNLFANDNDPDNDPLEVIALSQNGNSIAITGGQVSGTDTLGNPVANAGTIVISPTTGEYTFTPATGFHGTVDPITYTISDGTDIDTAEIFITVVDVVESDRNNTFAYDDANLAVKGTPMSGNVLTNDTDPEGDNLRVTSVNVNGINIPIDGTVTNIPGVGTLSFNANGTYNFIPLPSFVGTIVAVYNMCDDNIEETCCAASLYLTSLDNSVNVCYKPGNFTGTGLPTNVGISALRLTESDNWPMVREGAWIALESNTKGFVLNRLSTAQIQAIPAANLVMGMMVYNTTEDCLQINVDGTATGWNCFETQTCPD